MSAAAETSGGPMEEAATKVVTRAPSAPRNYRLDVLVAVFGMSSWISINGLWVELPLMVNELPESWTLSSYLSLIVQVANVGPIAYSLARWSLGASRVPAPPIIHALLGVGVAASILLSVFWDRTTVIGGEEHATALFTLVFFLSLVDCTSSVLFLPYMAVFRQIYLNSYLIGEGLSGFVPAIFALIQGVGGNPECHENTAVNETTGEFITTYTAVSEDPRFSVEVYFGLLAAMMVASALAFALVDNLKQFDKERVGDKQGEEQEKEGVVKKLEKGAGQEDQEGGAQWKFFLLLGLQTYVCFLSNGALPSIQTYSCLPYGNLVYHLAVTFHAMANPVAAFLAYFFPAKGTYPLLGITAVGSVFAGWILATAIDSPDMLGGQGAGGAMTVISWVAYGGLFSYIKVSIANWCMRRSEKALFWCGAFTQVGSAVGSLVFFFLVNDTNIFQQYYVTCP